ncbi:LysM peptidoglycan-binding domain-containing protein [Salmonella enterica subsp. enterica serovar Virchow]|nr:LysM peptidoglycan-binding domain-containing protein [Salmonella enterica subsp. enterica serovar Virchow]ECD4427618.1 LysM peptidoglycan-binding domain-containing protein [Salmonella enterica subsp. enterica serovar Virchow]
MSICHSSGGRRFRLCVWATLWLQAATPVALSLTPVMLARADAPPPGQSPFWADRGAAGVPTVPHTLKQDETVAQVAGRYGLTVAQLKKLNQFRVFARGFEHLKAGDELDVPAHPLTGEKAQAGSRDTKSPFAVDRERNGGTGEQQLAGYASQAGSLLSSHPDGGVAASMAKSMAVSGANQAVQDWVSQFGTAQVQLSVDDDFSLKDSAFNLLHPWYDTPSGMVFSQTGIHRADERTQTNLGAGYRHFRASDMLGANLFLDYDLSRDHARTGFGGEYWRDFLKLSANAYVGLTGWKSSPDVEDYDERPANGWDLRAEAWLPSYPQLGAKMVYEQYYGDEVGLFGKDERQKNPHALTLGMSYTPVPLLTLGVDQRTGQDGRHDTEFKAEMNYRFGESLGHQLDADAVAVSRSLVGSRYDLIDRNNDIVLEYRKQEVIRLQMPDRIEGQSQHVIPLTLNVQAKHGLKRIEWDDAALIAAGGRLTGQGTRWQMTLPAWKAGSVNAWGVSAVARDMKDNASQRAEMQVVVAAPAVYAPASSLSADTQSVVVGGQSTTVLTAVLKDTAGNPVTGAADQLTLTGALTPASGVNAVSASRAPAVTEPVMSAMKEDTARPGTYHATLTSGSVAGVYAIVLSYAGREVRQTKVNFTGVSQAAGISLSADNTSPLPGDTVTLTAVASDANGKALAGQPVTFRLSDSASYALDNATGTTDANGKVIVHLTSPAQHVGPVTVTATSGSVNATADVTFVAVPAASVALSADRSTPTATDTVTLTTVVKDRDGNVLAGRPVTFRLNDDTSYALDNASVTTDAGGVATVHLTSPAQKAGKVVVTAYVSTGGGTSHVSGTTDVTFSAVVPASVTLSADKPAPAASDTVTVTVVVKDANGVLLRHQPVGFRLNNDTDYTLGSDTGTTDDRGEVTVSLNSREQKAGKVVVTATAGTATATADVTFFETETEAPARILTQEDSYEFIVPGVEGEFPTTGFEGAIFTIEPKIGVGSDYNWNVDATWVSVIDGVVKFTGKGTGNKVTIMGVPKAGSSARMIVYRFTLKSWFIVRNNTVNWSEANDYCTSQPGYSLPSLSQSYEGKREVGNLLGEWGAHLSRYSYSSFSGYRWFWTSTPGTNQDHNVISQFNGVIEFLFDSKDHVDTGGDVGAVCRQGL